MNRILLVLLIACTACSAARNGKSTKTSALDIDPASVTITQQDVHPGAMGPVQKIRSYRVSFQANASELVVPTFLLVDSVKLKVNLLQVNDAVRAQDEQGLLGEGLAVSFTATRQFPAQRKPNGLGLGAVIPDELIGQLSGLQLEEVAKLEILRGDKPEILDLGEVTVLEPIYAP